jgi:hypothetical protein
MAVGVMFLNRPGAVVIERSIDGGANWVVAGLIGYATSNCLYVLQSVCGFVIGEVFRVIATEEPASINVLE